MNKHQEKVLVATLCGLVITAAAAFAIQPAMAAGFGADRLAQTSVMDHREPLDMRNLMVSTAGTI